MKVLTSLDLNKNELQNVVIQTLATAPETGKLGQIYYNSTDKVLYQHDGTAWKAVGKTVTYEMSFGELASNTVPINLIGSDGTTDTINLKGAGGATLSLSGNTLTITTTNTNTTYTFAGAANASGYKITITPSSGSAQTITIPLATATAAGLLNPADKEKLDKLPYSIYMDLVNGKLNVGLEDAEGMISQGSNDVVNPVSPLYFDKPLLAGSGYQLRINVDSSMSASSINPVQNKVVKSYVDNAIANLPEEQFLDLTKTEFVENFTWSNTTYPGSTNPNLDGKPVLVLALKDEDGNVAYSFINLEDLIDVYTGTSPINVSGNIINHEGSGIASGTYGQGAIVGTLEFGTTVNFVQMKVNSTGHLQDITVRPFALPKYTASESRNGLLSSEDKILLNKIRDMDLLVYEESFDLPAGETTVSRTLEQEYVNESTIQVSSYILNPGEILEPVMVDYTIDISDNKLTVMTFSIAQLLTQSVKINVNYRTYE